MPGDTPKRFLLNPLSNKPYKKPIIKQPTLILNDSASNLVNTNSSLTAGNSSFNPAIQNPNQTKDGGIIEPIDVNLKSIENNSDSTNIVLADIPPPLEDSEILSTINRNIFQFANNDSELSINNLEMARPAFQTEYLKCVPEFDGNPNELSRYLSTSEQIIKHFYDTNNPDNFTNTFIINSLIGKLSGNARIIVNIQNVTNWQELKTVLYRNFADQRDEACLNRDLVMLKQGNENPIQFHEKVLQLLNVICSHIDVHEEDANVKVCKKEQYTNLALKTFLAGLREPLGTTIRCMRPVNLSIALQYILEENNIHYYQNTSSKSQNLQNTLKPNKPTPIPNNNFPHNFGINSNTRNFPQVVPNFRPNNFQPPRLDNFQRQTSFNRPFNSGPFQPNRFAQPQYKQNFQNNAGRNVFMPQQNRIFSSQPTPMDVDRSKVTSIRNSRSFPAPMNLNNLEIDQDNFDYYNYYYGNQYYNPYEMNPEEPLEPQPNVYYPNNYPEQDIGIVNEHQSENLEIKEIPEIKEYPENFCISPSKTNQT